jgi:hypothetical protein
MRKSCGKILEKLCMKIVCKTCGKGVEKLWIQAANHVQNAVDFLLESGGNAPENEAATGFVRLCLSPAPTNTYARNCVPVIEHHKIWWCST